MSRGAKWLREKAIWRRMHALRKVRKLHWRVCIYEVRRGRALEEAGREEVEGMT